LKRLNIIRFVPVCLAAWILAVGANCYAAIIFPQAPEDGRQFAYKLVSDLLQSDTNVFRGPQLRGITISKALPTYSIDGKEKLLPSGPPPAWEYLCMQGTNLVASISLNVNPANGEIIKMGGVTMDSDHQTIRALNCAQEFSRTNGQDYEPRYLGADSSYRMLWLRGKTNDVIIPMEPTYGEMTPYCPYSEAQMMGFLRPYLERRVLDDLVSMLSMGNKSHAAVIEQIDLNIRRGLPSAKDVVNAKVLKRIDQSDQIEKFNNVLANATPGRTFVNHPVALGNCALRIVISGQPRYLFSEILESNGAKYCEFSVGSPNVTNVNRMDSFKSKMMPDWFQENGIEVK